MSSDLLRLLRVYLLYHNVGHLFFWDTIRSIWFVLSIYNVWHIFKAYKCSFKVTTYIFSSTVFLPTQGSSVVYRNCKKMTTPSSFHSSSTKYCLRLGMSVHIPTTHRLPLFLLPTTLHSFVSPFPSNHYHSSSVLRFHILFLINNCPLNRTSQHKHS